MQDLSGGLFMVLCMRSLAKVSFLHLPFGTVFISPISGKYYFHNISTSHGSAVKFYPFTNNLSSDQSEKYVDDARKFDLDIVISKALTARNETELFQSLVHDSACNTLQVTHTTVSKLLHRFQDDWKSALGIFRWVETCSEYKPLPELYDKLVDILGKMKQMEKMMSIVEKMREDHLVSLNTIAKVLRRLAGAGDWKAAIKTFDELENLGLEKNTESMNLLLDTLCKESKVEQARALLLELKARIAPNVNTYNIFIHGWCKIKRVEEAQWTIEEMKGYGFRPCVISYSTIIQSYCSLGKFYKVYDLLDEMEAQGCPPNVVTFTTIVHSLTKAGDFTEALQVAERMKLAGCKPDTQFYNALIHTLGRAGCVEDALNIFTKEMPDHGVLPNTSTYNTMIAMFCHHRKEQMALQFLRDLEKSPYCKPDIQSFNPLLKLYLQTRKTHDRLTTLLDEIIKKHHLCLDLATFTLLIHGLCRAGKCEWAYRLFGNMIDQGLKPRYRTCSLLLGEIRKKNMYDEAAMLEEFMKNMKSSPMMENTASQQVFNIEQV